MISRVCLTVCRESFELGALASSIETGLPPRKCDGNSSDINGLFVKAISDMSDEFEDLSEPRLV
jgi:hypothetical protein